MIPSASQRPEFIAGALLPGIGRVREEAPSERVQQRSGQRPGLLSVPEILTSRSSSRNAPCAGLSSRGESLVADSCLREGHGMHDDKKRRDLRLLLAADVR